jgi:predicted oxidoreductase
MRFREAASDSAADVIVAGSGAAGLCAAIEAAEAGARVVVLEAQSTLGGASAMSGAGCCLVDTPLQAANGICDSVELALSDWAAIGGPSADLRWARRYLQHSRRHVYEWCERLGIRWVALAQPEGNSVPRWHLPEGWGRVIVSTLLEHATSAGVQIHRDAPVRRLLHDGAAVRGVVATIAGTEREITAAAVVMATGGFVADLDLVFAAAPRLRTLPRLLSGGSPTAVGLGHTLLRQVGAQLTCLDHIWVYPNATPDPRDPRGRRGLGVRGITGDIWLNQHGCRFHNERLNGGRSGTAALLAQPGMTAWCVFGAAEKSSLTLIDNEYFGTPAGPHPQAMEEFWQTSTHAWEAGGPEDLARAIGLPPAAVRQSIGTFDTFVRDGLEHDAEFGRDLTEARPLGDGVLAAIQLFPMAQKNFGGVRTDLDGQVQGEDGNPIKGLFAAGEVAGMAGGCINGRAALEGTMFGPCVYSGRVAGRHAAAVSQIAMPSRGG